MADTAHAGAHHGPRHNFNLVDPSPWPMVGSMSAFILAVGAVMWMHDVGGGIVVLLLGFLAVLFTMVVWWRDVLKEAYRGDYHEIVSRMLRIGMVLFITSEVMFFVAWFWGYFWGALVPPELVATSWPPAEVTPVPAWGIPFLNTMILLLSGTTVTWAHHALREGDQETTFKALLLTVCLGLIFTGFQAYEYIHTIHEGLTIDKGIFGSAFYMATGFHGFHVIVGTIFLIVCTVRAYRRRFDPKTHVGFEAAAWYWHFVDVVWLFLFVWVYVWGGSLSWTVSGTGN
ncbi:MAG: cytochrome c oxidase subunit 3 [Geminicoccaceae bacterium]|nr:cytochrome c oxidase subunit 3 [Geminicoccaceae bacterium]MCB9943294.1 cytochrome c oxidase subunit 3 [Geminicoccaceae bacterium]